MQLKQFSAINAGSVWPNKSQIGKASVKVFKVDRK